VSSDERDHERVSEIFLRAVELPPGERSSYLAEACGDASGIREEVESLLAGDADAPDLLKSGVLHDRIQREVEPVPKRVGEFRIVEKIGEGGMGVVYRAEQEQPMRREVAVKLIKRGFETQRVVARFESERQALASMSHPSITQVFDAGATLDGRPYIVMELVEGVRITEYCDRHRMDIRERLELFIRVCEAVQHAHHKAIVHRDIKPSNILVTTRSGRPLPKIIDFGVAKATEQRLTGGTQLTEMGQFVGTPEFMSPEQAELNEEHVDTRTDVYSLGLVLYELLVGVQPVDPEELRRDSLDEIRRRIREDEAPRPSSRLESLTDPSSVAAARRMDVRSLVRQLRHDLDWVTTRALEKDPDRRYGSPNELAEDLRRHLREEPVVARPPSAAYRTRKFVRRNRIAVGFAATLLLLLVGFAAVMAVQLSRTALERNRADASARQAMKKAAAARQVSDFLVSLFALTPDRDAARAQLDAARQKLDHELNVRSEQRARLLYPLGQIYDNLGFDEGVPLMLEAMDELKEAVGSDDPEVLAAMNARGTQLAEAGRLDEADVLMAEVLASRRRVLGDDHRDTIRAMAYSGRFKEMKGELGQAELLILEAFGRSRRALGEEDPVTLLTMGYVANLRLRQGRLEEAEVGFGEVLELLNRLVGPEHPNTLACLYKLGCIRAQRGDHQQALYLLRRAVDGGWRVGWSEGSRAPTDVVFRTEPLLASLRGLPAFEELAGPDGYLAALEQARRAASARDIEEALRHVKLAAERGFPNADALLRDDELAPLMTHPEFQQIVVDVRNRAARIR